MGLFSPAKKKEEGLSQSQHVGGFDSPSKTVSVAMERADVNQRNIAVLSPIKAANSNTAPVAVQPPGMGINATPGKSPGKPRPIPHEMSQLRLLEKNLSKSSVIVIEKEPTPTQAHGHAQVNVKRDIEVVHAQTYHEYAQQQLTLEDSPQDDKKPERRNSATGKAVYSRSGRKLSEAKTPLKDADGALGSSSDEGSSQGSSDSARKAAIEQRMRQRNYLEARKLAASKSGISGFSTTVSTSMSHTPGSGSGSGREGSVVGE